MKIFLRKTVKKSPINSTMSRVKPIAIVFCRISRIPDEERGTMSLDSQEHAILRKLQEYGLGVYVSLKTVGSAYKTFEPLNQLLSVLRSSRNKVIFVYEPSRLSRSTIKFDEIWDVCKRNGHKIHVVSMDKTFDNTPGCYETLREQIINAQRESYEMGRRIARTWEYKRSREPVWGKMRNEKDQIVDNFNEQEISRLICMLGTKGSSVREIANLIDVLGAEGKEPFSLVEYSRGSCEDINVQNLPYGMSVTNIAETLKYYEIRHRNRLNWKPNEIFSILQNRNNRNSPLRGYDINVDSLIDDFEILKKEETKGESKSEDKVEKSKEWIHIWYDPSIGLPPNIRLPSGMSLPNYPCELYIPKM